MRWRENGFFRAMNRLDDRINARLDRSWMGRFARRVDARLARPHPPLGELAPEARTHVNWVLSGQVALRDPALMPYLRGRVRAYRRGLLWIAIPWGLLMFGLDASLKIGAFGRDLGSLVWGSLIWGIYPLFFCWLLYARAKRAAQAQADAFEGLSGTPEPSRRGLRGRTS